MAEPGPGARQLAEMFHERYERLAPQFGYETRKETRAFDPTTPNGRLMIAVCDEILTWFDLRVTADELARLSEVYRREREAHAANLKEQKKCEGERDRLREALLEAIAYVELESEPPDNVHDWRIAAGLPAVETEARRPGHVVSCKAPNGPLWGPGCSCPRVHDSSG